MKNLVAIEKDILVSAVKYLRKFCEATKGYKMFDRMRNHVVEIIAAMDSPKPLVPFRSYVSFKGISYSVYLNGTTVVYIIDQGWLFHGASVLAIVDDISNVTLELFKDVTAKELDKMYVNDDDWESLA